MCCRRFELVDDSAEQINYHRKEAYFLPGISFKLLAVKIIACHSSNATAIHTALLSDSIAGTNIVTLHSYYCGILHKCSYTRIIPLRRLYASFAGSCYFRPGPRSSSNLGLIYRTWEGFPLSDSRDSLGQQATGQQC